MTLWLVEHDTVHPAEDMMLAAALADALGAGLVTLDTGGGGLGAYEARQHVTDAGLGPNGLFWTEWYSDAPAMGPLPPGVIATWGQGDWVVPVNPAVSAQVDMARRLADRAAQLNQPVQHVVVAQAQDGWHVTGDCPADFPQHWQRDAYGRPVADPPVHHATQANILVVGSEHRQRQTYPAVLAALGDAADALGLTLTLRFWDPAEASPNSLPDDLRDLDGIVLPGGADMDQVAGQIRVARAAIAANIPLLGLCLGMQTMTTAVAQMCAGFNDANMEEAAPEAETKVFRRLAQSEVTGGFRIGRGRAHPVAGTRLAAILGEAEVQIPVNHRYVLDPALHDALRRAGLVISAWQEGASLADAVELPDQRFCIGLQGHPELLTRRHRPHPLFTAFLKALDL
ncbi:glutamine amidotransferase-related protein [Pseudooceanicola nitratireducens]|uniref:glutamine amidotransferase-related protein n=1 Tax=Pseudooceanicola nitratireducens TaxID=517719 RepID=UPI003C7A6E4F